MCTLLLLSMTYYCPLVALPSTASISISINFPCFHSPDFPLSTSCSPTSPSLSYHTQTFKGLICCIVWQKAPIMHCCVHSDFAFNGGFKQSQQKQEPWCFVAIVRPGLMSTRYCLVRVPLRNCRENVIRPVEIGYV